MANRRTRVHEVDRRRRRQGLTLIELVVTLALTAVVAGAVTSFLPRSLEGYRDTTRRAMLVDTAESALRRIARDVRRALPNSVRVNAGGSVLEFVHAADGGRYRRRPGAAHPTPSDRLSFTAAGDAQWNLLGRFGALAFSYGTPLPAGTRVAVYTTGATLYADAGSGADPGVITPVGTGITLLDDGDEDQLILSAPFRFRFESPRQRMYLVDTPVTYVWDAGGERLTRYWGYDIAAVQPTDPAAPPLAAAANAILTDHVTGATFTYQPGTPRRAALLSVALELSKANERIRLLQQIHVENAP